VPFTEHPSNDECGSAKISKVEERRGKQLASLFAQRCDPGIVGCHEPPPRADHKQNRTDTCSLYPLCTCPAPSTPNSRARVGNRGEKSAIHLDALGATRFCSHIARSLLFLSLFLALSLSSLLPPRSPSTFVSDRTSAENKKCMLNLCGSGDKFA